MKKIYLLTLLVLSGAFASAQVVDQFNYTGALNANGWTTHSGSAPAISTLTTASDAGNSLSFTGLASSAGNRTTLSSGATEDVNKAITGVSGTGYFSFLMKVSNTTGLNATGDHFIGFSATANASATTFGGRVFIKTGSAAGTFRLGISNIAAAANATFIATDYAVGTTYFVVVKYNTSASPTVAQIFVNPVPGAAEPAASASNSSSAGTFAALAAVYLRQGSNTGNIEIDEIRASSSWANVTPSGCATVNNMGAVSSCGTYTLNGTQYTASGSYSQVLANANQAGCDSTINFTLTVKQPTVNNLTISACNSYTLNGTTYTSSGNYQQVLTGANSVGCDSTINLALTISTSITYYQDADGDGYGNPAVSQQGCAPIANYVTNANDCDDSNSAIGVATVTYYQDTDGDGLGNPSVSQTACTQPNNYVTNSNDCDDSNNQVGMAQSWYPDADGDGYGSASATAVVTCTPPANHVLSNNDCNDNSASVHPGATEIPNNGIDEDCNGTDLNTMGTQLAQYQFTGNNCENAALSVTAQPANATFSDYSATADSLACATGNDYINYSGWNLTATVNPLEYYQFTVTPADCYELELTKLTFTHRVSNSGGTPTVHIRSSLDGFAADVATTTITTTGTNITENITLPSEFQSVEGAVTFRFYITNMLGAGATYRHDNVSVTGYINALAVQTYYADADGDGFGNPAATITGCTIPQGYVSDNTDCDDTDAEQFPGATWYADADADGFGNAAVTQVSCTQPAGYVSNAIDCNDNNSQVGGQVAYYLDADFDGFGDVDATPVMDCSPIPGYATNNDDCNDNNAAVNPDAPEVCDGNDNDCDGLIDESLVATVWYKDGDGDGFGDANVSVSDCAQPQGYVADATDCDDDNAAVNPAATDIPNNGADENCDGVDGYLSIGENAFGSVMVYPNPGTTELTVSLSALLPGATAQLISAEGKLISSQPVNGQITVIATENILPGVYFVKISNGSSSAVIRWIRK